MISGCEIKRKIQQKYLENFFSIKKLKCYITGFYLAFFLQKPCLNTFALIFGRKNAR